VVDTLLYIACPGVRTRQDLYAELSEQCQKYACDLLEQCRSSEEVIAVLNKSKYSASDAEDSDDDERYEGGVDEPVDEREFDEMEDDVDSPPTDDDDADDDDEEKITLDRFKLALKYEQKQVYSTMHGRIDHAGGAFDNRVTLKFDHFDVHGVSARAERLLCLPRLVLTARIVFLLECGYTHTRRGNHTRH